MREIARIKCGFFPTQDRIVELIADQLQPPKTGLVMMLDAGCGTGKALADLAAILGKQTTAHLHTVGIESDKQRATEATALLKSAHHMPIEDAALDGHLSLLWFNPPYDRQRGAGRMETILFEKVKDWPRKGEGLIVGIFPDYILQDPSSGLAVQLDRTFDIIGAWRYPEPEYQEFRQCVVIGRSRKREIQHNKWTPFPKWPNDLKILGQNPVRIPLHPVEKTCTVRRVRLGEEQIRETLEGSALRGELLREATAPVPKIGRPLLPLTAGHLALALAGGLCDGVIRPDDGQPFLVKGSTFSQIKKVSSKDQLGPDGEKVATIDTFRTKYEMIVRCLTDSGDIQTYSSAGKDDELLEPPTDNEEEEEDE